MISTREEPERNSRMITSRVFWSMSPWVADTVWSRSRILSVSQSTFLGGWGGGGGSSQLLNADLESLVVYCVACILSVSQSTFSSGLAGE